MLTNKFISRKRLSIFSTLSIVAVQAVVIGMTSEAGASYQSDPLLEHIIKNRYNITIEEAKYLVRGGANESNSNRLKGHLDRAAAMGNKAGFLSLMLECPQHDGLIVLEAWKNHGERALEAFRNNDDAGAAFDALARTLPPDLWDELSAAQILSDLGFDENDPELQSAANYLHETYCADADDIDMDILMTALTIQRLNIEIGQRDDGVFYDLYLTLQDLGVDANNYNEILNQPENVELLRNLGEV